MDFTLKEGELGEFANSEQIEFERLVKTKSTQVLNSRVNCQKKMLVNIEAEVKRIKKLKLRLDA